MYNSRFTRLTVTSRRVGTELAFVARDPEELNDRLSRQLPVSKDD